LTTAVGSLRHQPPGLNALWRDTTLFEHEQAEANYLSSIHQRQRTKATPAMPLILFYPTPTFTFQLSPIPEVISIKGPWF
jgi:hypothetical protein